MFGRAIDKALRASEERHREFFREFKEERERFEREMEQRYREEVQITREVIRRNELTFQEGMRTLARLVEVTKELRDDIRAQRQGFLAILDRLENGGEGAAS